MLIKGIAKGDKDLRHFTFDDEDYVVRGGVYYYKVNYGKNPLEGEYGEEETGFVECNKVIPLGGKKPKPIQSKIENGGKLEDRGVVNVIPEKPKRGRPPKNNNSEQPSPSAYTNSSTNGILAFEYLVEETKITSANEFQDLLNKYGESGWELCCYDSDRSLFSNTHIRLIFKRKRG